MSSCRWTVRCCSSSNLTRAHARPPTSNCRTAYATDTRVQWQLREGPGVQFPQVVLQRLQLRSVKAEASPDGLLFSLNSKSKVTSPKCRLLFLVLASCPEAEAMQLSKVHCSAIGTQALCSDRSFQVLSTLVPPPVYFAKYAAGRKPLLVDRISYYLIADCASFRFLEEHHLRAGPAS